MQTFLPYKSFAKSAKILDRQRLGKQRVEVLQILNALHEKSKGWRSHPATKMWQGHTEALVEYGIAICREWKLRGYKDTCLEKITEFSDGGELVYPSWLGDDRVHSSHRSNLLRKDASYYEQFDWTEDDTQDYYWPV